MPTATVTQEETKTPATSEANPELNALAEKYVKIPFDDSKIVKYGETPGWEVLRKVAEPVTDINADVLSLIADMSELMYQAHGVGLAAPQVGKSIRVITYDAGEGIKALLNPEILRQKGEQYEPEEGCLSIPGLRGVVKRSNEIMVKAMTIDGKTVQFKARDFEARVLQHEIDHLNGILFIDLADPATLHMLTPAEQAEEDETAPAE